MHTSAPLSTQTTLLFDPVSCYTCEQNDLKLFITDYEYHNCTPRPPLTRSSSSQLAIKTYRVSFCFGAGGLFSTDQMPTQPVAGGSASTGRPPAV